MILFTKIGNAPGGVEIGITLELAFIDSPLVQIPGTPYSPFCGEPLTAPQVFASIILQVLFVQKLKTTIVTH